MKLAGLSLGSINDLNFLEDGREVQSQIEQLNFIWLLASTFHDIGYPVDKLSYVEQHFKKFLEAFSIDGISLEVPTYQLQTPTSELYISQLASLYEFLNRERAKRARWLG
jgi:hypothetical protein